MNDIMLSFHSDPIVQQAVGQIASGQKQTIPMHVGNVLEEREKHPEKTMAQLYDPDDMPDDLREAHAEVDALVDSIYSNKPFETDEQRLSDLFAMYERMTAEGAAKAPANKTRRPAK